MARRGALAAAAGVVIIAEDEEGRGQEALEDGAEGGEAGGDDVVCGFVDGPDCPDDGCVCLGRGGGG